MQYWQPEKQQRLVVPELNVPLYLPTTTLIDLFIIKKANPLCGTFTMSSQKR